MAQAGVAGDLAADALAFAAQHVAHALQLGDDAVDFLHRRAGDALDQRVHVLGAGLGARRRIARLALPADVAADEFTDLAFEGAHRLIDVAELGRRASVRRVLLRTFFLGTHSVCTEPLGFDRRHALLLLEAQTLR